MHAHAQTSTCPSADERGMLARERAPHRATARPRRSSAGAAPSVRRFVISVISAIRATVNAPDWQKARDVRNLAGVWRMWDEGHKGKVSQDELRMALAATFPDAPPLQDKEFVRRRSHGARSLAPWLPSRARRPAT
eukprot:5762304-Prymnesium_polylepis.1